jgi:hypothetical protein
MVFTSTTIHRLVLFGSILGVWVRGTGLVEGAYIIRLKNGNEYVTSRYWQEGGQVLFDTYGGIFGIEKSFVTKIEKTDKAVRLVTAAAHNSSDKFEAISKESGNDVTKEAPAAETKSPAKKDENDPVYKEFNSLKAQFRELTAMLTDELDEYLKKVAALISKIQRDRKINQYLREYTELNMMANKAEEALKSRR